jgi:hypothetical protein
VTLLPEGARPDARVLYEERRFRLVIQVVARWTGVDYNEDELANAAALAAADATYHPNISDLDWQAATLRRLGYQGLVL